LKQFRGELPIPCSWNAQGQPPHPGRQLAWIRTVSIAFSFFRTLITASPQLFLLLRPRGFDSGLVPAFSITEFKKEHLSTVNAFTSPY
jgi:hypothetical protein